jgi:hypothetical protein
MSYFIIGGTNVVVGRMSYFIIGGTKVGVGQKLGWDKCQVGQMSGGTNVRWDKCQVGQMSVALLSVGQKLRHQYFFVGGPWLCETTQVGFLIFSFLSFLLTISW